jgi:hypothetical protein
MRFRTTRPEDFPAARDFIPESYRYGPELRETLPAIWTELLGNGQLCTGVVENPSLPEPERLRGVGLSLFVTEDFADSVLDEPRPFVNARLHRMIVEGRSPVLDRRQIVEGNSGDGLSLLSLHFCTSDYNSSSPEFIRVAAAAQDLFGLVHAGYRIRRILKEVVCDNLSRYMQASGMDFVTRYDDFEDPDGAPLPDMNRPNLLLIDCQSPPHGSLMSRMFISTEPRFGFSPAEQRLLQCALLGETEEDAACALGISLDTVRKQWRSIYQRVLFADPLFFGDDGCEDERGGRGREKRRHLLRHLSLHMEEIRPYRAPASARGRPRVREDAVSLQTA